jgi:hypothetical protein
MMIVRGRPGLLALSVLVFLMMGTTSPISASPASESRAEDPVVLTLLGAVAKLPVSTETRDGYDRREFRHWNAGRFADGCDTRREVLIHEAVVVPTVGRGCALDGGSWWSYYDEITMTSSGEADIDHMVPLAEAWDSGAHGWTPARREAYANDQDVETSLVAVTARSNRSKADRDPAEWLPPSRAALCRYLAEWTATKLRWGLTVDTAERQALTDRARISCSNTEVTFVPA